MRLIFRRLVALAVLSVSFPMLVAEPAAAHTGFESSDPADNAVIGEPVDRIEIRFSGPAEPVGEGFVVLDATGVLREPDGVSSDEDQLVWTLLFDPALASGSVGVRWTVQAPDAHPIDGSFSFAVTAPPPPLEPANDDDAADVSADEERTSALTVDDDVERSAEQAAEATPPIALDAFLAQSAASSAYAGQVAGLGRFIGLGATTLGLGAIVFAATVIGSRRREVAGVLNSVRVAGAFIVAGAMVELIGQVAGASLGWGDLMSRAAVESTVSGPYGVAIALRAVGGLLLFWTVGTQAVIVSAYDVRPFVGERVAIGVGSSTAIGQSEALPGTASGVPIVARWRPTSLGLVFAAVLLLLSFTFDGHTTSEGSRWLTGVVDIIHVAAGAVWAGGVVALAAVLWLRHRQGSRLDALELAVRFSVLGAVSLVAAGVAGTVLTVVILDSPVDLWSTPWGRILIVKALAVAAAAGLGAYNHFLVIPWLNDEPGDDSRSVWLRNTVTGEALVLVVVVALTAALVGAAS